MEKLRRIPKVKAEIQDLLARADNAVSDHQAAYYVDRAAQLLESHPRLRKEYAGVVNYYAKELERN